MQVVDVETTFPGFKLGYEDTAFAASQDPWHKVIVCRHGHICPAGGSKLWACTKGRGKVAQVLLKGEDVGAPYEIKMDGDDGINVEFDAADWRVFFDLMKARAR